MIKEMNFEDILKGELDDLNYLEPKEIADIILESEDEGREELIETLKSNYPLTQTKAEELYEEILKEAKAKYEILKQPSPFDIDKIYEDVIEGADKYDVETLKEAIEEDESIGGIIEFDSAVKGNYGLHGGLDAHGWEEDLTDEQTDKMIELYRRVINEYKRILELKTK